MRFHLGVDTVIGLLLVASPWLYGFAGQILWPHLTIGLFAIAVAFTTTAPDPADVGVGRNYG
jgi:hypothetical protein